MATVSSEIPHHLCLGFAKSTPHQQLLYVQMLRGSLIACENFLSRRLCDGAAEKKTLRAILLELNRVIEASPINMEKV